MKDPGPTTGGRDRRLRAAVVLVVAAVVVAVVAALVAVVVRGGASRPGVAGPPLDDPRGVLNLPDGFRYRVLAVAGRTPARSAESGAPFTMPEDPDANVVVRGTDGSRWLVTAHELARGAPGAPAAPDAGKAVVPEQAVGDDGDADGWGSVTRARLRADGTTRGPVRVITTGLNNLCAGAPTPWGTVLVNEEAATPDDVAPFRSGFVWEVDPTTGRQTKLTGMGRFDHEQEARIGPDWYLTSDTGGDAFLFRFTPDRRRDLASGRLFGLAFDRTSGRGRWVGPLDPADPAADMTRRGHDPATEGFSKSEGIVTTPDRTRLVLTESGVPGQGKPGAVWLLRDLTRGGLRADVIAVGDFATLSHPDNARFAPDGDLYVLEDNGPDLGLANGAMNEIRVLPRGATGTARTRVFATVPGSEPTGPWFDTGDRLYLSLQGAPSRIVVVEWPR